MAPYITNETLHALDRIATSRGVDIDTLLSDFFDADARFRKVAGRVVLSTSGGVPALADKCNDALAHYDQAAIRRAVLRVAALKTAPGPTLADALTAIGRNRKAREVLDQWPRVMESLRQSG